MGRATGTRLNLPMLKMKCWRIPPNIVWVPCTKHYRKSSHWSLTVREKGGETTQTLYAYINKKKIFLPLPKKKKKSLTVRQVLLCPFYFKIEGQEAVKVTRLVNYIIGIAVLHENDNKQILAHGKSPVGNASQGHFRISLQNNRRKGMYLVFTPCWRFSS
jgi:hypothetical protein